MPYSTGRRMQLAVLCLLETPNPLAQHCSKRLQNEGRNSKRSPMARRMQYCAHASIAVQDIHAAAFDTAHRNNRHRPTLVPPRQKARVLDNSCLLKRQHSPITRIKVHKHALADTNQRTQVRSPHRGQQPLANAMPRKGPICACARARARAPHTKRLTPAPYRAP